MRIKIFKISLVLIITSVILNFNLKNIITENKTVEIAEKQIPVLMYHHFQSEVPDKLSSTVVTPEEFEDHLKALKDNGYKTISFYEYYKYIKENEKIIEKPIIITIDDGYTSNYTEAFPLLKKYKAKAAISIVTSTVGTTPGSFPHFTWEQAKEMEDSGFVEIFNHTSNHKICSNMSKDELIKNVSEAQNDIDKKLGNRKIKVFTYPEGKYTEENRDILKNMGFDIQITVDDGVNNRETPLNGVKRINIKHGLSGVDLLNILQSKEG